MGSRQDKFLEAQKKKELSITPLYQQTFRWFREKYGYEISIHKLIEEKTYMASIYWTNVEGIYKQVEGSTYEQAELECLKKLIEIVTQLKKNS